MYPYLTHARQITAHEDEVQNEDFNTWNVCTKATERVSKDCAKEAILLFFGLLFTCFCISR